MSTDVTHQIVSQAAEMRPVECLTRKPTWSVVFCDEIGNSITPCSFHFGVVDCIRNISRSVGEHPSEVAKTAIADHVNLADIGYCCGPTITTCQH